MLLADAGVGTLASSIPKNETSSRSTMLFLVLEQRARNSQSVCRGVCCDTKFRTVRLVDVDKTCTDVLVLVHAKEGGEVDSSLAIYLFYS